MRRVLMLLALLVPLHAVADHIDVIEVKLNEGCSLSEYVAIKNDFNANWGSKNGYRSEVFVAIQSQNLASLYWVGRSANAEAFGKAWDQWRTDLANPESVAARLWARFQACGTNVSRRGYDTY